MSGIHPINSLIRFIIRIVTRHPRLTILSAFVLSGLSILYTITFLEFETGQKDLIASGHRLIRLSEAVEPFDDLDRFAVAIENQNKTEALAFVNALADALKADKTHYKQVFYRIDPDIFKRWALLYLDMNDLAGLADTLAEHQNFIADLSQVFDLAAFFELLNREITAAMVGELFTGFLEDDTESSQEPFDLTFLVACLRALKNFLDTGEFHSPLNTFFKTTSFDDDQGYFYTENKRYFLLFVTPNKIEEGFNDSQASLQALRETIADVRAQFPSVQVGVTGQEALNVDEMASSLGDMTLATILSVAGLTLLLTLFWKDLRRPLFEMTELIVALSLTFGLTTCFIGHLNILSVVFAPLLLGLGIDYGIHWLARYQEERSDQTLSSRQAVEKTMTELGPGIILAGFTAALSFFPLVLTGFKGLVELGVICSMGMVMTTLTTLFLLPALTLVFDKAPKTKGVNHPGRALFALDRQRAILILSIGCILLVIALWAGRSVTFDLNMLRLQSTNAESVIWEKKLLSDSKRSSMYGAVLAHTRDEIRSKSHAIKKLATVSEVHSIETLVPDHQDAKLMQLRQLSPLVPIIKTFKPSALNADIKKISTVLARIRFKMSDDSKSEWGANTPVERQMRQVSDLIDLIRCQFDAMKPSLAANRAQAFGNELLRAINDRLSTVSASVRNTRLMRLEDLPEELRRRFISPDNLYLIRVFPMQDIWETENLGKFVQDLRTVDPDVIGDPVTLYTFTREFRNACIKAAVYAVIFIIALLLCTFRNLRDALLAMTPLLAGTIYTMGMMRLFGINLNLANTLFLPLIVGAGVEYGIIILQRWHTTSDDLIVLPFSTGKGIVLAGLTTTVGFGSLIITDHQGTASLGLLAMVGSLCVLAAAVLFLPAIMRLLPGRSY